MGRTTERVSGNILIIHSNSRKYKYIEDGKNFGVDLLKDDILGKVNKCAESLNKCVDLGVLQTPKKTTAITKVFSLSGCSMLLRLKLVFKKTF